MSCLRAMSRQVTKHNVVWHRLLLYFATSFLLSSFLLGRVTYAQTYNDNHYCKSNGRIVLFLIDVTTPFGGADKELFIRVVGTILATIRGGDDLIVRTISDSYIHSDRLIDRCIPSCNETSNINQFFECANGAIKNDRDNVFRQFNASLRKRLFEFEGQKHSDIVRTIQTDVREESREGHPMRLFIYSDLIENSDFMPSSRLYSEPVKTLIKRLKHEKLIANLKNVDVDVAGVGWDDSNSRQPLPIDKYNKLIEFWRAYFKESGATNVRIGHDLPSNFE
jgi:hypothetical protein